MRSFQMILLVGGLTVAVAFTPTPASALESIGGTTMAQIHGQPAKWKCDPHDCASIEEFCRPSEGWPGYCEAYWGQDTIDCTEDPDGQPSCTLSRPHTGCVCEALHELGEGETCEEWCAGPEWERDGECDDETVYWACTLGP